MTDLTVKNIVFTVESVEINWFNSEKYFFTDESVKSQITDSISQNLTDSDLESRNTNRVLTVPLPVFSILGNSSPSPTRTQLEIRKDRKISTWGIGLFVSYFRRFKAFFKPLKKNYFLKILQWCYPLTSIVHIIWTVLRVYAQNFTSRNYPYS